MYCTVELASNDWLSSQIKSWTFATTAVVPCCTIVCLFTHEKLAM